MLVRSVAVDSILLTSPLEDPMSDGQQIMQRYQCPLESISYHPKASTYDKTLSLYRMNLALLHSMPY